MPLANFHHLNRGPEESPSMGSLHLDVFTQPRPKADIRMTIPFESDLRPGGVLGLIVTELVINALKHGFPAGAEGEILVSWSGILTVTDTQGRSAKGVGRHQVICAPQKTLIFRLL